MLGIRGAMMLNNSDKNVCVKTLEDLICKTVPKAQTVNKYGGKLYTLKPDEKEGQFCGVFPYKEHVQLAFSLGTSLKDPNDLLEGTGKFRRHININTLDEINVSELKPLIREAAKISLL